MIQKGWQIDLFVLSDKPVPQPALKLESVSLIHIQRSPCGTAKRLFDEAISGVASFANWVYEKPQTELASKNYSLAVCSPISTLDFPLRYGMRTDHLVAAINDVYTAVLKTYPFDSRASRFANRLRALRMRFTESHLLENCRTVLVQTPADKNWIDRIGGAQLAARSHAIHNAANQELIAAAPIAVIPNPRALFIADLSNALYQQNLSWLHDCWRDVTKQVPHAKLRIVGKGLETNPALHAQLKADTSVELPGFVKNLVDAYLDVRVVAAPIFKSYGFMNKVAEAAAMGLPVVGDLSAFNGMNQLLETGGSIAADSQSEFTAALVKLLTDDSLWQDQARKAKTFARQELTTAALYKKLDAAIGNIPI
jgi:glycosyltransferase involved in cell wall biosynthesis